MKTKPKKPIKKLSARARKQDVPNAWYHSLKNRVEILERDILELQVLVKGQVFVWVDTKKGRKK